MYNYHLLKWIRFKFQCQNFVEHKGHINTSSSYLLCISINMMLIQNSLWHKCYQISCNIIGKRLNTPVWHLPLRPPTRIAKAISEMFLTHFKLIKRDTMSRSSVMAKRGPDNRSDFIIGQTWVDQIMSKLCVSLFDPSGCSHLTENDTTGYSENKMDREGKAGNRMEL